MKTSNNSPKRRISRKTLLVVSIIADIIDLVGFGALPLAWSLVIDVPVTILHFLYAGPCAFLVLAEYIPLAGFLPIYTIATLCYGMKQRKPTTTTHPAPNDSSPPQLPLGS